MPTVPAVSHPVTCTVCSAPSVHCAPLLRSALEASRPKLRISHCLVLNITDLLHTIKHNRLLTITQYWLVKKSVRVSKLLLKFTCPHIDICFSTSAMMIVTILSEWSVCRVMSPTMPVYEVLQCRHNFPLFLLFCTLERLLDHCHWAEWVLALGTRHNLGVLSGGSPGRHHFFTLSVAINLAIIFFTYKSLLIYKILWC